MPEDNISHIDLTDLKRKAISKPLVEHIYTADPSALSCGVRAASVREENAL